MVTTQEKGIVEGKALEYLTGFGNEHASEALTGAIPIGRNSPQTPPYGLYAEKLSGTAFTAPRDHNHRSWFYRIRPSVVQGSFKRIANGLLYSAPIEGVETPPDQLRWDPFPVPERSQDFVDGLATMGANGNVRMQAGIGIHLYLANTSMVDRFFYDADGELLVVPQQGALHFHTEFGIIEARPGEIVIVPRGVKFRVALPDGPARGYVCENYGAILRLPERGPIGSDGLANTRDFQVPTAAYETREGDFQLVCKLAGNLFACDIGHSPLDVVAWHGNLTPCKYDLNRFNTMGSISFDHPDPSIFTVLTSASDTPGTANVDFVIFPPRWLVMEDTFRPPWFHRNMMSEFMGLIYGMYDAKTGGGFSPGGASLHNCMSPHGPDAEAFEKASQSKLKPTHLKKTLAFMFESRYLIGPTRFALECRELQDNYQDCWEGLARKFDQ